MSIAASAAPQPPAASTLDALPIGPTGKVLKRELRDQLSTAPAN